MAETVIVIPYLHVKCQLMLYMRSDHRQIWARMFRAYLNFEDQHFWY